MKKTFFILALTIATFTFATETHTDSIQSENTELTIDSIQNDSTAILEIEEAAKALKVIENGQIVIIKNGTRYNASGQRI